MNPRFIAEVSSNHNSDLKRCFDFIDTAAAIGCDAIKFQLFKIDQLFAREVLLKNEDLGKRKCWELPKAFLEKISGRAKETGIQFSCTPFYIEAVDELLPYIDFFKIASYELIWDELLINCGRTKKPVMLSTGMATLGEVVHAVDVLRHAGCSDIILLHCVSSYPVKSNEANLAAIETLSNTCRCPVGWSDHSRDPGVVYRAVHRWGATVVEFHLDLDETGYEYPTGHCWLPSEIQPVIKNVRAGMRADGDGCKIPQKGEMSDRDWRADPSDGLRPLKRKRHKRI